MGFFLLVKKKKKKRHSTHSLILMLIWFELLCKIVKGRREEERRASGRSVKDVVGHSLKSSDQTRERKAAEGQNILLSLPPLLGVHTISF